MDIVANSAFLQGKWAKEQGMTGCGPWFTVLDQIKLFRPDIIFLQDVGYFSNAEVIDVFKSHAPLAAQISCSMPDLQKVKLLNTVFTSFPHYVPWLEMVGVRGVYLPLAVDPIIGARLATQPRTYDCTFVGGVGTPSHWSYGMEVLETVAMNIPTSRFYGYGYNLLPSSSVLCNKFYGPAWGLDMYEVLGQSRIVINRHGEVASKYANNLKLFETTLMGALLVTDLKANIRDFFEPDECVTYDSPADAVDKIRYYIAHPLQAVTIAARGQARTLRDHTYAKRMPLVSETLEALL